MGKQQRRKVGPAQKQPKQRASKPPTHYPDATRARLVNKVKQCVVIIDVPNINSYWRSTGNYLMYGHFSYHTFRENLKSKLESLYPTHVIILNGVVLYNERDGQNYYYLESLAREDEWKAISKPKVGDSDIDDNIVNLVEAYIQTKRFDHIILVGNDLENHLPLFHHIRANNTKASLVCFTNLLSETRTRELARYQLFDFRQLAI